MEGTPRGAAALGALQREAETRQNERAPSATLERGGDQGSSEDVAQWAAEISSNQLPWFWSFLIKIISE